MLGSMVLLQVCKKGVRTFVYRHVRPSQRQGILLVNVHKVATVAKLYAVLILCVLS